MMIAARKRNITKRPKLPIKIRRKQTERSGKHRIRKKQHEQNPTQTDHPDNQHRQPSKQPRDTRTIH